MAYAAPTGAAAGGELEITGSTVIGKVHARILRLVSNSILAARLGQADSAGPVVAERRQDGCPLLVRAADRGHARRHRCRPTGDDDAIGSSLSSRRSATATRPTAS